MFFTRGSHSFRSSTLLASVLLLTQGTNQWWTQTDCTISLSSYNKTFIPFPLILKIVASISPLFSYSKAFIPSLCWFPRAASHNSDSSPAFFILLLPSAWLANSFLSLTQTSNPSSSQSGNSTAFLLLTFYTFVFPCVTPACLFTLLW